MEADEASAEGRASGVARRGTDGVAPADVGVGAGPGASAVAPGEGAAPLPEGVVYRSSLAGPGLVANVVVGVAACGAIGSLLGMAIGSLWIGAAFGALVVLGGWAFARGKDEVRVRAIEADATERSVRLVALRGEDTVLAASELKGVRAEGGAAPWVLFVRSGGEVLRVRVGDAGEASRVARAVCAALGMEPQPELGAEGAAGDEAGTGLEEEGPL